MKPWTVLLGFHEELLPEIDTRSKSGHPEYLRWVTNADPAMLRILAHSERFKTRYDAAKQEPPLVEVR